MDRKELLEKHGKHAKVTLWKKFSTYDDKLFYEGTLRGALKRIPEGREDQFEIIFLEEE